MCSCGRGEGERERERSDKRGERRNENDRENKKEGNEERRKKGRRKEDHSRSAIDAAALLTVKMPDAVTGRAEQRSDHERRKRTTKKREREREKRMRENKQDQSVFTVKRKHEVHKMLARGCHNAQQHTAQQSSRLTHT
jgi:hypothetical protein